MGPGLREAPGPPPACADHLCPALLLCICYFCLQSPRFRTTWHMSAHFFNSAQVRPHLPGSSSNLILGWDSGLKAPVAPPCFVYPEQCCANLTTSHFKTNTPQWLPITHRVMAKVQRQICGPLAVNASPHFFF